jgi:threonine synthase
MTTLTHLDCTRCGARHDPAAAPRRCACGGPLLARYDLEAARAGWSRDWVKNAPSTIWRYAPVLPLRQPPSIVSLGEGMTPLLRARRLGERLGLAELWIKDEGLNPTGSAEARGISCAVSMAVELGVPRLAIRSTGNGAAALAAYAAAAGIEALVVLPADAPPSISALCRAHGARISASIPAEGWLDLTEPEPYHVEGAKTLGYEVAEQFSWALPSAVVCPPGEGASLPGLAKAFEELEQLGWTAAARPRLIAATASAPECIAAALDLAALEGILAAPEGAAAIAALPRLLAEGQLQPGERIVAVTTVSGLKSLDLFAARFPRPAAEADKLGGLITPR